MSLDSQKVYGGLTVKDALDNYCGNHKFGRLECRAAFELNFSNRLVLDAAMSYCLNPSHISGITGKQIQQGDEESLKLKTFFDYPIFYRQDCLDLLKEIMRKNYVRKDLMNTVFHESLTKFCNINFETTLSGTEQQASKEPEAQTNLSIPSNILKPLTPEFQVNPSSATSVDSVAARNEWKIRGFNGGSTNEYIIAKETINITLNFAEGQSHDNPPPLPDEYHKPYAPTGEIAFPLTDADGNLYVAPRAVDITDADREKICEADPSDAKCQKFTYLMILDAIAATMKGSEKPETNEILIAKKNASVYNFGVNQEVRFYPEIRGQITSILIASSSEDEKVKFARIGLKNIRTNTPLLYADGDGAGSINPLQSDFNPFVDKPSYKEGYRYGWNEIPQSDEDVLNPFAGFEMFIAANTENTKVKNLLPVDFYERLGSTRPYASSAINKPNQQYFMTQVCACHLNKSYYREYETWLKNKHSYTISKQDQSASICSFPGCPKSFFPPPERIKVNSFTGNVTNGCSTLNVCAQNITYKETATDGSKIDGDKLFLQPCNSVVAGFNDKSSGDVDIFDAGNGGGKILPSSEGGGGPKDPPEGNSDSKTAIIIASVAVGGIAVVFMIVAVIILVFMLMRGHKKVGPHLGANLVSSA